MSLSVPLVQSAQAARQAPLHPWVRALQAAFSSPEWTTLGPPADPRTYAEVLPAGHRLLTPSLDLPGREAFRAEKVRELLAAAPSRGPGETPVVYFNAGGMGVGKLALYSKLQQAGVVPRDGVVAADADYIHTLIPEHEQLRALGDNRAAALVHDEASAIARAAFREALQARKDILYNSMLSSPDSIERLKLAKAAGYRVVVLGTVVPVEVGVERAGANGRYVPVRELTASHKGFADNLPAVERAADLVVVVDNSGDRPQVVCVTEDGSRNVLAPALWARFQAARALRPEDLPEDAINSRS